MKAKFSYLTGFSLVLSGILIGTAGIVWATHLTRAYENGIFVNALDSLNLSGNHYVKNHYLKNEEIWVLDHDHVSAIENFIYSCRYFLKIFIHIRKKDEN